MISLYEGPGGAIEVRVDRETVWLTQRQTAEVFDSTTDNIGLHLKNIYADSELEVPATTEEYSVVQQEGGRQVRRDLKHYSLDAIISVGYRVNSRRGVHFRQWATRTLKEHLTRGYTLNRQRLEENARELETALILVRRVAAGEALATDQGRRAGGCHRPLHPDVPVVATLRRKEAALPHLIMRYTLCLCTS